MKITKSESIKSSERELIDSITADLDWGSIEKIFKEQYMMKIDDDVEYKSGDMVVFENQVAYKLDFDVKVTLSVMFDRAGNYLSMATPDVLTAPVEPSPEVDPVMNHSAETIREPTIENDHSQAISADALEEKQVQINSEEKKYQISPELPTPNFGDAPTVDPKKNREENMDEMASKIADMISEINTEN